MFVTSPVFGVGGGQYGFKVEENLPEWAFESWEVRKAIGSQDGLLPIYSLHVRILAELGILGLLAWAFNWASLWKRLLRSPHWARKTSLLTCLYIFLTGLSSGSFRPPATWVLLGVLTWLSINNRED